jgi:hypothetical protein
MFSRNKLFVCLLISASALLAQTPTATITGIVTDPSQAAIAGAIVVVRNTGTNISHSILTSKAGEYTAPLLPVGPYDVTVEAVGFKKSVENNITLQVDQVARLDFTLAIGRASETVEVTSQLPAVQTDSSEVGQVVDNTKVVEMPLNGRQFYSLATLVPGAYPPVQNSTLSFRGGINVAGSSEVSNNFTLNGFYNNDANVSAPNVRPSVDNIQEFKLLTGVYPAEYGYGSGGQVVVTTKSGTNQFHGTLFEYVRNSYMDARNFFLSPTTPTPPFKRNQFGGTVGGPIKKDKTFAFFSYEGLRSRQDIETLATVPLPGFATGNFSALPTPIYEPGVFAVNPSTGKLAPVAFPGNMIPTSMLSRAGLGLLSYFPAPTFPTAAGAVPANNYLFSEIRQETMNEFALRLDHSFNQNNTLAITLNYFNDPAFEPSNTLCSARVLPNFGCYTNQTSQLYGSTYTHVFSPSLVNEFRAGMGRLVQPRTMQDTNINFNATYGINAFNGATTNNTGVPPASITGYATIGGATNLPQKRYDDHFILGDALIWTHDKHTIKYGADLMLYRVTDYYVAYGLGSYSFTSGTPSSTGRPTSGYALADVLLGLPFQSTTDPTAPRFYNKAYANAVFAQDDYKIARNLTLNFGLRWELDTPVTEQHDNQSSFNPTTGAVIVAGKNGVPSNLYNSRYNDFAPRFGFSWQPTSDSKTVVRGGAGVFYNFQTAGNGLLAMSYQYPIRNLQTFTSTLASPLSLSNPFAGSAGSSVTITGIAQNFKTATVDEWSVGIQRELVKNLVLDVSYFGTKGTHLPVQLNINQPLPSGSATVVNPRPYPSFANITFIESVGNADFNSLQAKLDKHFSGGLSFLWSFTWGRSIDDGNGVSTSTLASATIPQNSYNLQGERGRSDFDVKYRSVFSPVYELPFGPGRKFVTNGILSKIIGGWQLSALFTASTGTPLTPYYTTNNSGTLNNEDRPNVVAGANPNSGPKNPQEFFNTAAFTAAPAGTFGNAGRNIINGPNLWDLDTSLVRNFKIRERANFSLRGQFYNTLNHPNFNYPNASFGTAAFGTLTSSQDPREVEIAARLIF